MHNLLFFCDQHVRQTFVADEIKALTAAGCQIRTLFRISGHDQRPDHALFDGFTEKPQVRYSHYVWYLYLKLLGVLSTPYSEFLAAYADWPVSGRAFGAARALRWHRIQRSLRGWTPHLIHVHFAWNLPYAIPLARLLGRPLFCTVHGSDIYLRREWRADLQDPVVRTVICVSDGIKTYIEAECPQLASKTVRIYNPINETFLQDVVPPGAKLRVISISAFRELKNHAWLLRGLHALQKRNVDFECVIVGATESSNSGLLEEIRAMTDRLGLSEKVNFKDWLQPQDVRREIDQSTVLALTSTSEGFGMVIVEALARQRMPVVTDLPGTRDATGGGEFGILVPLNDDRALADALLKAHKETVGQTEKIRSGRQFVLQNLHPNAHLVEIQKIYESALAE